MALRCFQKDEILNCDGYSTPSQKQAILHNLAICKGRQELFFKQHPETLERLLDTAMIESVRASTLMEGVVVPGDLRLRELLKSSHWRPRNRDEEDVVAYKRGLDYVYKKHDDLSVDFIVELSNILWAHDKNKAGLKKKDNKIVLTFPDGFQAVRFVPPSARETPRLLRDSCKLFNMLIQNDSLIDHQVISAFILDLLCIHPLEDGNGRLARLIHAYLLLQSGYDVARYVSLEALIESDKGNYYDCLNKSSRKWESAGHNFNPWMNFCLGKLNLAYKRLERQLEEAEQTYRSTLRQPEQASVEKLLEAITQGQVFDRTFIEKESATSGRTTRRILAKWQETGRLIKLGSGPATKYQKVR